jgi:two-component system sensor histidine kinase YesM
MRKIPVDSLRFRIITSVISILSLLVILILFNNIYAIRVIRNQVFDLNKNTLAMFINQIDLAFSDVETYLSGYAYNNSNLASIENPARSIDRYTALYREQQNLNQALAGYNAIDGLFIYSKPGAFYIDTVQRRIDLSERNNIKKYMINLLDTDDSIIAKNAGQWFSYNIGDSYYLCRILKIRNTYVGAWTKTGTLTNLLIKRGYNEAGLLFFSDSGGIPMDAYLRQNELIIPDSHTIRFNNDRYLIIAQHMQSGPYSLVSMVLDNSILQRLGTFQPILIIVLAGILFITALLAIALNKSIVQPLNGLTEAINSLKSGNLDARIVEKKPCREFIEVNQAFHDMTAQIKHLKIGVYEEKLLRQNIQLLYLKQQLAPHFLINCLNTIYSLASTGKNNLVQQISLDLSSHLRYTLSDSATVTLKKELEHVINYIKLSQIRFPNSIAYEVSISDDILSTGIPSLMLQTFVENTIKHEATAGKLNTIYITGEKIKSGDTEQVHIKIWDTGEGFPPDILQRINSGEWGPTEDGKNIGIYNIIQRLELIYKSRQSISFSNREGAGAQIEIIIPYEQSGEEVNEHINRG